MFQLENLSYSDMLFLREDPRVRAKLLQLFQPIRQAFAWLTKLTDDAFLRYLVTVRIIGFSLEGRIEEVIDTRFPPVMMVGSCCALIFIDLCWNIGYYYPGLSKLGYVPLIKARSLTFMEDRACAFITHDHCYGVLVLANHETGERVIHTSYGRVRQIMSAYMVSDSNCLYHVILEGTTVRFQLLSSSCDFITETQTVGTYKRVSYRHIDGSSKVMFSYGERFLSMDARSCPGVDSADVKMHMMRRAWEKHGFQLPAKDITMYQWGFYRIFTYRNTTYIASDVHQVTEENSDSTCLTRVDQGVIDVTSYLGGSKGCKFYGIRL